MLSLLSTVISLPSSLFGCSESFIMENLENEMLYFFVEESYLFSTYSCEFHMSSFHLQ